MTVKREVVEEGGEMPARESNIVHTQEDTNRNLIVWYVEKKTWSDSERLHS